MSRFGAQEVHRPETIRCLDLGSDRITLTADADNRTPELTAEREVATFASPWTMTQIRSTNLGNDTNVLGPRDFADHSFDCANDLLQWTCLNGSRA